MFSSRDAFESDFCPVQDELLGEMYRASESGLPRLVESVSPDARAKLALFCYRRSHLHSLAVAIAGSCNERDLIENGGRVGSTLYALSREVRLRHRRRCRAAASRSRCRPSRSRCSRRSMTSSTTRSAKRSPLK
ncbi:hypothetical protein QUT18_22495, partial [Xanthomonas citri pv. citri]